MRSPAWTAPVQCRRSDTQRDRRANRCVDFPCAARFAAAAPRETDRRRTSAASARRSPHGLATRPLRKTLRRRRNTQHVAERAQELVFLVRLAEIEIDAELRRAVAMLFRRARRAHDD